MSHAQTIFMQPHAAALIILTQLRLIAILPARPFADDARRAIRQQVVDPRLAGFAPTVAIHRLALRQGKVRREEG